MVDINRVFIPSKLRSTKMAEKEGIAGAFLITTHPESPVIEYKAFRQAFQRVAVLGDPGGGKSTLCQYLCYELSKHLLLGSHTANGGGLEYQLQKIPLRVVLRTFEKARKSEPQLDIFSFVCREIRNSTTLPIENIESTIRRGLDLGQIVLAFDGLDEILDTSLRRDFVEIVVGFCDQFPLCPVCVTSRHVGYEEARLPDVFEEVYLERFDDREVKEYVEKFLRVVANCTKKEAHDGAAEFLNQTEKNARDLRQNPLLLGLMSWLFYMKGDVPINRPEIYGECAMLMFEKWDQRRGIEANVPDDFDMLHLFSELAAKIYGDADLEGGVDSTWLRRQIKAYFERQYEERPRAHATANLLVEFITGRSWVMSEFGQEVFRFTHRTFLEYFFARHLDELHEGVEALLAILRPRIIKGEWDIVSHLALQLKAHRHARRTEEAIVALRHLLQESVRLTDRRRASVMRFTATALEYLPGAETGVRALVSDLYRTAVAVAKSKPSEAAAAVVAAGCGAKERRDVAQKAISEHLFHSLQQGGCSEVLLACTVLSRIERGRYSIPEEIRTAVLTRAKSAVMAKARRDAFLAGVY